MALDLGEWICGAWLPRPRLESRMRGKVPAAAIVDAGRRSSPENDPKTSGNRSEDSSARAEEPRRQGSRKAFCLCGFLGALARVFQLRETQHYFSRNERAIWSVTLRISASVVRSPVNCNTHTVASADRARGLCHRVNLTVAIPPLLFRNEIATVRPAVM